MTPRSRANEIAETVARLGSRSPKRVDAARTRLASVGAHAVEALIEALERDNNRIRSRVMPVLSLIQDPRGREPLIAMLLDRSAKLRESAARCLARFPSPDAVRALNRSLRRDVSIPVKVAAAQTLVEQYSSGQEQAIGRLLDVLMDADHDRRVRLAALALVPALHPSQQSSVLKRLERNGEVDLHLEAHRLIEDTQNGDSSRSADLGTTLAALASENYTEWHTALHRLAGCGARMVTPLIAEMRSRSHDPEYCTRAGMALKTLGPRRGRDVAEALNTVDEPLPLQILVEVIGASGDKSMIYRLTGLIERMATRRSDSAEAHEFDPFQRVRSKAHLELARIGSRVAIGDLHDCLTDTDNRLELDVLGALELIGNREEIGLLLKAHSREDEFMRERIGDVVRVIMRRERLRRNERSFAAFNSRQRQALGKILPPVRARPARSPRSSTRRRPPSVDAG